MAKITQAQLRFLEKVIRTTSCACNGIGEWRTRQFCQRKGWLENRPIPGNRWILATYLTDAGRAAMNEAGRAQR